MSASSSQFDPNNPGPSPTTTPGAAPASPSPHAPSGGVDVGAAQSVAEFRPYRRFVTWTALTFISIGVAYLLLSVAITIYRQRHAVGAAVPIGEQLSRKELTGCWQQLDDVRVALEKHLEKSHYLLGPYDQGEAQRWASEGDIWRSQWRQLGDRCRFGQPAPAPAPPHFEELGAAWRELGDTATTYTKELLRFVREQSPRLDRLRIRINRIGTRLGSQ
ncbi:MAG TPA: hypothetical protein VGG33_02585 [Polyangia bacterium]